jgi:HEAT repeat protein
MREDYLRRMNILDWISSFRFNFPSFLLGFLAASLFWWLVKQLTHVAPGIRQEIMLRIEENRKKSLAYIEDRFRQTTLRKAQALHLGSPLFALDEIVISPTFLAPPLSYTPDQASLNEERSFSFLPHPLDYPELVAQYPYPRLTPAEAISKGANITILGEPGQGKTVAIAYLASLLARRDTSLGGNSSKLPVLMHVNDLDLEKPLNPVDTLLNAVLPGQPVALKSSVTKLIRTGIERGELVILIDGGDELGRVEFDRFSAYLIQLTSASPKIQVVTCASPYYMGSLPSHGFHPLMLSVWSQFQRTLLIEKWLDMWFSAIEPSRNVPANRQQLDPAILKGWVLAEITHLSPLELTLKVWTLCAGDIRGSRITDFIETYIRWTASDDKARAALQEKILGNICTETLSFTLDDDQLKGSTTQSTATLLPRVKKSRKISIPELIPPLPRSMPSLLESGLVKAYAAGRYAVANPLIAGYLSSCSESLTGSAAVELFASQPLWCGMSSYLHFTAVKQDLSDLLESTLEKDLDDPLGSHLFMAARWLRDLPPTNLGRTRLMKQLVEKLQNEALPISLRYRAVTALGLANDPVVTMLIKQLLGSPSNTVRKMATIATGFIQDPRSVPDLVGMLKDPDQAVQQCACMALAVLDVDKAFQAIAQIILSGDEELARIAAVSLTMNPRLGQDILRDGSTSDNLLVRRAAVFGLARITEQWATEILEKMVIEDAQWVVRSAVTQVLEDRIKGSPSIPTHIDIPSQSAWLVEYASRSNMGIPVGSPALDVLVQVLTHGRLNERVAALGYLTTTPEPDQGVLGTIYKNMYGGKAILEDAAAYAVWIMVLRGVPVPATRQFGLG